MNQGLQSALRIAKDKVEMDMDRYLSTVRHERDGVFEYWPKFISYLGTEGFEIKEKDNAGNRSTGRKKGSS
jgi:hypothetical protein